MRARLRRARGFLIALAVACLLALAVHAWIGSFDPRPWVADLLAFGAFLPLGAPALLLTYATLRRGDPYDVSHRYPGRATTPATAPPR